MDGQKLEQVDKFKYLGSWITDDDRSEVEIKSRIAMTKQAFNNRRELLTIKLKLSLKKKLVNTLIWVHYMNRTAIRSGDMAFEERMKLV